MRKIIHIDMDCFYAAIEIRDNPTLANKPIAVGGHRSRRGVLSTCNYIARKYGIHSGMPTAMAYRQCPDLIVLPVNMEKYKSISKEIREIFFNYTDLVEPLSFDEAYLDVSNCKKHGGSATWIASKIRKEIFEKIKLTASAGIASNKFLAKIASDWNKPNGQFVIKPSEIDDFVKNLKIEKIMGVGKVTAKKLHRLGIRTCQDIQRIPKEKFMAYFGKFGERLYELSFGKDTREVSPKWERKSCSVERTYAKDIDSLVIGFEEIDKLFKTLVQRLSKHKNKKIHKQFIKIKFNTFSQTTVERVIVSLSIELFKELFKEGYLRRQLPYRLIGLGVRFENHDIEPIQLSFLD